VIVDYGTIVAIGSIGTKRHLAQLVIGILAHDKRHRHMSYRMQIEKSMPEILKKMAHIQ
jgi:hypothetical protein